MGDRANIFLRDSDTAPSGIYLYTHWSGTSWPEALQTALKFGQNRWGDPPYLARIIASRVFFDIHSHETGGGLSTFLTDNEHPILCVDLERQEIGLCDEEFAHSDRANWYGVMSFEQFVALSQANWKSFSDTPASAAMPLWAVYDADGECVGVDVAAQSVSDALAQFTYAGNGWYALPQKGEGASERCPECNGRVLTPRMMADRRDCSNPFHAESAR